jgi:hypothetical protein
MVAQLIGTAADPTALFPASVAKGLGPDQRKELSIQVLAGNEPVSRLSARHQVSRKFVYRQVHRAEQALDEAFAEADGDDRVLFQLPVTKAWLRQMVLAQVLIGHTSYRGVGEIFDAAFGLPGPSVGTVHNILAEALPRARAINDAMDLSGIGVGAHDEIYQARRPVLVGADVRSTYCYLLAEEDHADETTWGNWRSSWSTAPPVAPPPVKSFNGKWNAANVTAKATGYPNGWRWPARRKLGPWPWQAIFASLPTG